jgi:BirA family biotin operon repressor/biotin-[acetyl-CoA-carboxylase] ligase
VPFAAGLAVIDTLDARFDLPAALKWPNDVLVGDRKLAGVLVEVEPDADVGEGRVAAIVGLGLNLDGDPPLPTATCVREHTAKRIDRDTVLEAWLDALGLRLAFLETRGLAELLPAWRRRAVGLHRPVSVATPAGTVAGTAVDVRDDGALLVRTPKETVAVVAGDVFVDGAGGG